MAIRKRIARAFHGDRLVILFTGVAVSFLFAALYVFQPPFFQFLDHKIYDRMLIDSHSNQTSGAVVIVDIDEASLAEFGQWPWPRYRVALLLARLKKAGVLAVGMDILFAEQDRTSPDVLKEQLRRDLKVDVDFTGLPDKLRDNDKFLASFLSKGPFVISYYFQFHAQQAPDGPPCNIRPLKLSVIKDPGALSPEDYILNPTGVSCPLSTLLEGARRMGFYNSVTDADGIIRRLPLIMAWNGKIYPNLSLATLMTALRRKNCVLKLSSVGTRSLRVAKGLVVPLDSRGQFLLNYRGGARSFPYVSAADVMDGGAGEETFQNKIALIGTSAAGLQDLRATPFGVGYPGVEAHATAIDNIVTGEYITRPDWAPGMELMAIILAGLVSTLFATWTRATISLVPLTLMAAGLWFGAEHIMATKRLYVSPLFCYLVLAANFVLLTFLKFLREERKRRFIHSAFSQYVSPKVVSQIVDSPEALSLAGEEKEVTILFSDVRSFTSLSEKLTPTQVVTLLNDYLTPMTKLVTDNSGTLDKFIGDALMAFWNAPVDVEKHQSKGVAAALAMLEELDELNKKFVEQYGFPIAIGVGVHSGPVRVGNMGSQDLFDYTLIGDNVNLASRLEGLTKFYHDTLVVSEAIREACADEYLFLELDKVRVKGKKRPITIYKVFPLDADQAVHEALAGHEKALALYQEGEFHRAGEAFSKLSRAHPEQYVFEMYEQRCRSLAENPPEEWDGVYTHTSK